MGWGAAHALAEEWSEWCSGPEEAYEILYGPEDGPERIECPICKKRLKGADGVIMHMTAKHDKPCHEKTIENFKAMFGRE